MTKTDNVVELWPHIFLRELLDTGNPVASAKRAGVPYQYVNNMFKQNKEFNLTCKGILKEFAEDKKR